MIFLDHIHDNNGHVANIALSLSVVDLKTNFKTQQESSLYFIFLLRNIRMMHVNRKVHFWNASRTFWQRSNPIIIGESAYRFLNCFTSNGLLVLLW